MGTDYWHLFLFSDRMSKIKSLEFPESKSPSREKRTDPHSHVLLDGQLPRLLSVWKARQTCSRGSEPCAGQGRAPVVSPAPVVTNRFPPILVDVSHMCAAAAVPAPLSLSLIMHDRQAFPSLLESSEGVGRFGPCFPRAKCARDVELGAGEGALE